jgi:hypothetical protein
MFERLRKEERARKIEREEKARIAREEKLKLKAVQRLQVMKDKDSKEKCKDKEAQEGPLIHEYVTQSSTPIVFEECERSADDSRSVDFGDTLDNSFNSVAVNSINESFVSHLISNDDHARAVDEQEG